MRLGTISKEPILLFKDVGIYTKKKYKMYDKGKLKYTRRKKPILQNISLEVNEGDFVVLVGDNGVGKTTLLKSIVYDYSGLEIEGTLRYLGRDVVKSRVQEIRQSIGNVFQEYSLIEGKTVKENIMYPLLVLGKDSKVKKDFSNWVYEISTYLGIEDKLDYYPHQLSGGQIQRVKIARSMVLDPDVYLVDEPTSNLDKTISRGIMKIYEDLNKEGKTIIMVTHHKELLTKENKRVVRVSSTGLEEEI